MDVTKNEEDYIKALLHLSSHKSDKIGTNLLAEYLQISAASVSNMLKKLKEKGFINYEKYTKISLTPEGTAIGIKLIRKHRLWETFLYNHMNFSWDEIHDVAEQLEHIRSPKLIRELDRFLGYPKVDPHGEAIPSENGEYILTSKRTLAELGTGELCRLTAVKDNSPALLKYLSQLNLGLGDLINVIEVRAFDGSMLISFKEQKENVSKQFAEHIYIEKLIQ